MPPRNSREIDGVKIARSANIVGRDSSKNEPPNNNNDIDSHQDGTLRENNVLLGTALILRKVFENCVYIIVQQASSFYHYLYMACNRNKNNNNYYL